LTFSVPSWVRKLYLIYTCFAVQFPGTIIKDQIKELAKDKKSTLIAKGAILSDNVPDYTDLLKESLEDQTEEGQQAKEED